MKMPSKDEIAALKADRERRKGAPLTGEEELWLPFRDREGLSSRRADPRDEMQKMADAAWKPKMAVADPANATDYSADLAEAEAKVAKTAFAALDVNGQYAALLRERHEAELKARGVEQSLSQNAGAIGKLQALLTDMLWSPEYTPADIDAVRRALTQYATPGACPVEADRLMSVAVAAKAKLFQDKQADLAAQAAQLQQAKAKIDHQLAALTASGPDPLAGVDTNSDEYWRAKEVAEGHAPGYYVAPLEV